MTHAPPTRLSISTSPLVVAAFLVLSAASLPAEEFDFQDPKGVNVMSFLLDSLVEPVQGVASGISGKVEFDPDAPKKISGKIVVDAASLHIHNDRMMKKLHSSEWIDVAAHPTIEFELKSVSKLKADKKKGEYTFTATGDFTLHGVTKEIAIPIKATYLEDGLGKRIGRQKGDLLVLRSEFTIDRMDFKISPTMSTEVVAKEIQIRMAIVGTCKKE